MLARQISAVARAFEIQADPSQLQVVGIAVAQDADSNVRPFWSAALGYEDFGTLIQSTATDATRTCRSRHSRSQGRAAVACT